MKLTDPSDPETEPGYSPDPVTVDDIHDGSVARAELIESHPPLQRAAKRVIDIVLSLLLLTITSPLMLTLAALVKLTSRGPVLFTHERIGRGGRPFVILKFRTMAVGTYDAVRSDPELWKVYVAHDHKLPHHLARSTPIGRWLRILSLDELPQLVNVLKGDMSLVGVRPIERTQLDLREATSQMLYCRMRPGLTGLWQVTGRSTVTSDGRITLDDSYVLGWSLLGDIKLLLRTPAAVMRMAHAH